MTRTRDSASDRPQRTRVASAVRSRSDFAQDLEKRKTILLTVHGRRTERTYTFPVWCVVRGETLWLLPVRGERTQWYQNVLVNPALVIRTGHRQRTFVARPVDHGRTVSAVVAAFRKKYTPKLVARYYPDPRVAIEVPLDPRYTPVTRS